jgi:hypothetical protein
MKDLSIERGRMVVKGIDGKSTPFDKKIVYKQRREAAILKGVDFLIRHPSDVLSLPNEDSEEVGLRDNPEYFKMVKALEFARVSSRLFSERVKRVILASPQRPHEDLIPSIVCSYVGCIYKDIRRLEEERTNHNLPKLEDFLELEKPTASPSA